jgi:hypothetical protein
MTLSSEDLLACAFCGSQPLLDEYVELQLRIEGTAARQYLGAHKACLEERTRPNVHLELESEDG